VRPSGRISLWAAGALALLVAAWLSPRVVPYNMDEFVHYHALGCATATRAPALPLIRDGCGFHDLRLPLTAAPLPLRSYLYIGSFPALPFFPFWRLFGDPVAARIAGACCFLAVTLLAGRLLRVRTAAIATASLVFPVWLVSFVVDEGPVGLCALLLLLSLLCARRALDAAPGARSAAWAAACGLALFLGLWTKLVFAWWLPVVATFLLEEMRRRRLPLAAARRHVPALLTAAMCLTLPTGVLLASVDRDGQPYAAALRQGRISADPGDVEAVALRLTQYLTDGALVAPRNVTLPGSPLDVLPLALSTGLLVLGGARTERRWELARWAAVSALTFALVASSEYSRWPHHFAFPLLPLVLALALALDALAPRERLAATAAVLLYWAALAVRLPQAQAPVESSPDKDRLLAFVRERRLDRDTLQIHSSWGTYYVAQLFGDPARMVVYARRVTDDLPRLNQLAEVARQHGRPIVLLSSRRLERLHTPAVEQLLGRPQHTWQFGPWWALEYRPPLK
jgi:hypothetical protein